jgi:hypothetical protein
MFPHCGDELALRRVVQGGSIRSILSGHSMLPWLEVIDQLILPSEAPAIDAARAPIEVAEIAGRRLVDSLDVSGQVTIPSIAFDAVPIVAEVALHSAC